MNETRMPLLLPAPFLLRCLACATLIAQAATAAEITLAPVKDSPIYGDDGGLAGVDFLGHSNGAGYTLYVGTNGTGSPRRSLLQFDFSSLPPGAVVTAASLSLAVDREPNASNQLLSLHVVTTPWTTGTSNSDIIGTPGQGAPATPGDATWYFASWPGPSNVDGVRWNSPGGDFLADVVASTWVGPMGPNFSPLPYTWSGQGMVDSINAWLREPATNYGWMMTGNERQTQSVKRFISREAVDSYGQPMSPSLMPHLIVTYEITAGPSGGTGSGGGSSVTPQVTPPLPWGKLRRRTATPRPLPCCW
jgi:hypothetical protein